MKLTRSILLIYFSSIVLCFAEDLTTMDGKKYTNITVKKATFDGVSIQHADGVTTIPVANLPADFKKKIGLDREPTEEEKRKREEIKKAQDQALAKYEAEQAANRARAKEKEQKDEAFKAALDRTDGYSQLIKFHDVRHNVSIIDGVARVDSYSANSSGNPGIVQQVEMIKRYSSEEKNMAANNLRAIGTPVSAIARITNLPMGIGKDGTGSCTGSLWRIGQVKYFDTDGLSKTVPRFTSSKEAAAKFYMKHGFGIVSNEVVYEGDKKIYPPEKAEPVSAAGAQVPIEK